MRVRYTGPVCDPPPKLFGVGDFGKDGILEIPEQAVSQWIVNTWGHPGCVAVEGPVFGKAPIMLAYFDPTEIVGLSEREIKAKAFKRWCARNDSLTVED